MKKKYKTIQPKKSNYKKKDGSKYKINKKKYRYKHNNCKKIEISLKI